MNHRFSWRLGILVILILVAIFAWLYPNVIKNQRVIIRQSSEIRSNSASDDDAAREAIQRDNSN